jgi:hypothetical protein
MALYINKSSCKKALLEFAKQRAHKFTRVGSDVFDHLDGIMINAMKDVVSSHPSMGVTICMGTRKRKNKDELEEC